MKNQKNSKNENSEWMKFDIEKAVKQDLDAALSFLLLLKNHPGLLETVTQVIEDYRLQMIEREKESKKLDNA